MTEAQSTPPTPSSLPSPSGPPTPSTPSFFHSVLDWLHRVYPNGIPRTDYYPLLALLKRSLSEDEVVQAAFTVLKDADPDDPVTPDQIRAAILEVTEKEPIAEEVNQVAARLASVGWPLTDHG